MSVILLGVKATYKAVQLTVNGKVYFEASVKGERKAREVRSVLSAVLKDLMPEHIIYNAEDVSITLDEGTKETTSPTGADTAPYDMDYIPKDNN